MNRIILIFVVLLSSGCIWEEEVIVPKHIFYLHGKIIEDQGRDAVSETFGSYQLDHILKAIYVDSAVIHTEIRKKNTDIKPYAVGISYQIDSLIAAGVSDTNITVIGASKGAVIAAEISHINSHPINYILLAGNNDSMEARYDWQLRGRILCIFDASDSIAGKNYDFWRNKTKLANKFVQLELHTGLGHGFVYQPIKEWIAPSREWILTNTLRHKE